MDSLFRFKQFSIRNEHSALKVGTDAVLLGSAVKVLPSDLRILDIGTGTGVIALMLAQRCPEAHITGIDIDSLSFEEAKANFLSSPWLGRLTAVRGDLRDFHPNGKFNLIVSNPPFYDSSLLNPDGREAAAKHSVSLSVVDICAFSEAHLTPEGRLSLVFPSELLSLWKRTAASFGLFVSEVLFIRTTDKKPPKRIIAEFVRERPVSTSEKELILMRNGTRSEEHTLLTKDFYL